MCQNQRHIVSRPGIAVKPFICKGLTMSVRALQAPRFVRRTQLGPNEYRKNFRQIDGDVISAVTSPEADRVTPLMSKIYLRLVHAPAQYWERDGVLRFEGELREDCHVTAWVALCEALGVASATASKALQWMHEQGIIGYFAGKNGVGIRIFLNRASSSIGSRAAGKKILEFPRASSQGARASTDEAAFSDSFADLEVSDTDINPRAPKNSAEMKREVNPSLSQHQQSAIQAASSGTSGVIYGGTTPAPLSEEVARVLLVKIGPSIHAAASAAAAREHERTREWLESRGLPKMIRVAQRETFNVLRRYGVINEGAGHSSAQARVGRSECGSGVGGPQLLSREEVDELAQACVAMLEVQGQAIERTLSEMSSEGGGFLLPDDIVKIREKTRALLATSADNCGKQ